MSVDWFLFGLWIWGFIFIWQKFSKENSFWYVLHSGAWAYLGLHLIFILKALLMQAGIT
jgi:hypothetical protein